MAFNPIRDSFANNRFSYIVELVASAKTTEEKILDIASGLASLPGMVASGITSYAGGSAGHDPIRISTIVRERGLTPNVHLTCVGKDRMQLRRSLEDLHELGIENVFAITGDYPHGADPKNSPYDLDAVHLIEMISELRDAGYPFHISCAVSPFKYTEPDCVYQYLKLEKKFAAGADFAITQLGYDSKKFRELKRYLAERGINKPVYGNVYILAAKPAEKFNKGEPPGCWASKELVERIQAETNTSTDKGVAGRLERAAKMVAIVRGLGYAGAYIGGDHHAERLRWVIQRSEEIADRWEEWAEEISYSPKGGFFYFDSPAPKPKPLRPIARVLDVLASMFPVKRGNSPLRRFLSGVMGFIDKRPSMAHALERLELLGKKSVFGCQACGNCVLGEMEYVCPMTCPKNLRNGPCGGTFNGQCEVIPSQPCIWVSVYDTAKATGRLNGLRTYIPPRNRALQGTSSFINLFLNRDARPGNAQPLIQITMPAAKQELVSTHQGGK